ncbi:hypothetical protein DOTSEDRAFT_78381 [Dothistroma septosporum NZE10]|uniref:Uncharacterized protein n=1 Tax=Dothistroma septosporum (strain NZE10 / CBS 128990) TaxID=675120 RepID=N1PU38_DOTSN|nr:hypothetical protein DOTSEDRAFT_78381 [Dothistroma septosporum NZE10]
MAVFAERVLNVTSPADDEDETEQPEEEQEYSVEIEVGEDNWSAAPIGARGGERCYGPLLLICLGDQIIFLTNTTDLRACISTTQTSGACRKLQVRAGKVTASWTFDINSREFLTWSHGKTLAMDHGLRTVLRQELLSVYRVVDQPGASRVRKIPWKYVFDELFTGR